MPELRKIAIIAPHGLLGHAWTNLLSARADVKLSLLARADLNLTNPGSFERVLGEVDFDYLINCAAYTAVDDCEVQGDLAFLVNGSAPGLLARIAARRGARMIHFSTDFVFDGRQETPYTEMDTPNPISVYGRSKLAGETAVLAADANNLVVRLSWLFGRGRAAFPEWLLTKAQQQAQVEVVGDKYACPTHAETAAAELQGWLEADKNLPGGVLHYANAPGCSWAEYGQGVLDVALAAGISLQARIVKSVPLASLRGLTAPRPLHSMLDVARFTALHGKPPDTWQNCLHKAISVSPRPPIHTSH